MKIFTHPRALLVVLLLPLLVAGVGMWALKDRVDRLDKVPAAVVNLDEGTHMTVDGKDQFVPFGRSLAGALTQPGTSSQKSGSASGFDWRLTDEEDARDGLRNGEYAAVIVIPKNFSKDLGTLGSTDAQRATIEVTTNDASGALDSALGSAIAQAAASSTGTQMTRQYLSQLYVGFNQFHDSLGKAADGAHQLYTGADGLSNGLGQTSQGASKLATGAEDLAGGTRTLSDGVSGLSSGLRKSAQGGQKFAGGMDKLASGAQGIAQGNRSLAGGLGKLHTGADGLADGAAQLSDGINGTKQKPGLVSGVDQLQARVDGNGTAADPGLVGGSKQLAAAAHTTADGIAVTLDGDGTAANPGLVSSTRRLSDGTQKYTGAVSTIADGDGTADNPGLVATSREMAKACAAFSDEEKQADPRIAGLCRGVEGTQGYADALHRTAQGGQELAGGTKAIADGVETAAHGDGTAANPGLVAGSRRFADGASDFAQQAPRLAAAISTFSQGIHRLGDGAQKLADGNRQLADGIGQSATGADTLADGAEEYAAGVGASAQGAHKLADGQDQLADGSDRLAQGSDTLATGADSLASGTKDLSTGTQKLADGAQKYTDGTQKYATGLREGADKAPHYSDQQRSRMSAVGALPVTSSATRQNEADGASTAVFPFVVSLALWLGAFGAFLLLPALSRRLLDSALPMTLVALRSLAPAIVLGLVQTVAVLAVITAIGITPLSPLSVGVIAFGGAIAFAALHQALLALLGNRVGRIASIVVMVLQVVVLAGILPLQTAPPLLQSVSAFMPITIVSKGLIHAALGGSLVSTSATLLALVAWALGSFAVTLVASRSARSLNAAEQVTEADALPA